jgi:glutaredoxin-like protein
MERLLSDGVRGQVKQLFKELKYPVTLILFTSSSQNCEYCEQTQQLLDEIASLSDLLSLNTYDLEKDALQAGAYQVDKAPGIVIAGKDGHEVIDFGVRYYGIPAGSEFTALIHDVLLVSKRDSGLSQPTRDFLRQLSQPLNLRVFVTPT